MWAGLYANTYYPTNYWPEPATLTTSVSAPGYFAAPWADAYFPVDYWPGGGSSGFGNAAAPDRRHREPTAWRRGKRRVRRSN